MLETSRTVVDTSTPLISYKNEVNILAYGLSALSGLIVGLLLTWIF